MPKNFLFSFLLNFLVPAVAVYCAIWFSDSQFDFTLFLSLSTVAGVFQFLIGQVERKNERRTLNLISDKLTQSAVKIEKLAISNADSAHGLKNSMTNNNQNILVASSKIDELNVMTNGNGENIDHFRKVSSQGLESIKNKRHSMISLFEKINSIANLNEAAEKQIHQSLEEISGLLETVREIGNETSVINDIVFQTKLLSFNASVESARAGEYGKGFAVVAEEIGKLALISGEASNCINRIVEDNIAEIDSILNRNQSEIKKAMNNSSELIKECVEQSKLSEEAVDELNQGFSQIAQVAEQIAAATNEQSTGVREINESVHNINSESEKIVDSVEVSSQVSSELKNEIENLSRLSSNIISFARNITIDEIDVTVARSRLKSHVFIDVRRPEEWRDPELGVIRGARLMTLNEEFESSLAKYDATGKYIFVCRSGGRSLRATRIAQRLGFKNISNMQGGMLDWQKKGFESVKNTEARMGRVS